MNGLLRRLTRRRAATADENPPGTPAASEPVDATVVSLEESSPLSEEERTHEEELRRRRRDLPAGLDAEQLEATSGEGSRRGALRRRIRYLRRVREVLLRDLGGFFYEVHRTAGGSQHGGHRQILETKAGRLAAVDEELRTLEDRLGERHPSETVVREPGIGGTCPSCGELHGSDAGWCAHCGTPLSDRARKRTEHEVERTIAARHEQAAERARAEAAASAAASAPGPGEPAAGTGTSGSGPDQPAAGTGTSGSGPDQPPAGTGTSGSGPDQPAADAPTSELPAAQREDADPVAAPGEPRP